jgi:hypothetical protein
LHLQGGTLQAEEVAEKGPKLVILSEARLPDGQAKNLSAFQS